MINLNLRSDYIAVGQWGTPNAVDFDVTTFSASPLVNPPNCDASLTTTTDVDIVGDISWSAATGAPTSYDLTVGITTGGAEVLTTTDIGNVLTYNLGTLAYSTTYYVNLVPKNGNGLATGCMEQTFVTEAAPGPGEACSNPIVLTVESDCSTATPYTIDYSTAANLEAAGSCDTTIGNTGAWFEFTAPASGALTVNASDSNEIAILDACGGTEVICNSAVATSHTITGLTASAVYKLAVWKDSATTGTTDVCLEAILCIDPSTLTVANITQTSADLSWTENGTASIWNMEWGIAGFTQGSGTTVTGITPNPQYNLSSLMADTSYDFYVQSDCGGNSSTWIGPFNFFTGYCIPSGTSTSTYIDNFSTTNGAVDISNLASGLTAGNYQDNYGTMSVSGASNGTFDFNVEIVSGTVGCAIWIDWNNDLVFDVAEVVYSTTSYGNGSFTGTVTIPSATPDGDYRMRVMIDWNDNNPGDDAACSFGSGRGEVEDYKVTVDATLSTMDFEARTLFDYAPNPVREVLTLNARKNISNVVVYNMLGQDVIHIAPNAEKSTVDMSKLKTGTYFVKVIIDDAIDTIKIIKN